MSRPLINFLAGWLLLFAIAPTSGQERCRSSSSYPEVIISPWSNLQKAIADLDIDDRGNSVASVFEMGNWVSVSCHLLDSCGNRSSEPLILFKDGIARRGTVAKEKNGDFFVAWLTDACARAQAFDGMGQPLGEVRFLSPGNNCLRPAFGEQGPARMVSDGFGHYLVAWNLGDMNGPDPGTIYGTRVRQYDRSGVWLGLEFSIDNTKYYEEIQQNGTAPVIGLASRNGITVLVTLGLSPDRGFLSYTVWILDENLTLRRPPFFATTRGTWPTDGWSPEAVAMSSSGDFTVVWQYPGDGWFDGTADVMDRILAQRFSRDGERLGEEIAVSGPPILHAQFRQPAIAMDAAGNSIVAWPWIRRGLIIGQRFAPDGQKLGRIFQINVSGPGRDVAIPALNDDGVMAVGYSLGEDAGPQAVATRILDFHAQEFIRGDADDSLSLDITDAVAILDYLFAGGTLKPVWMAGDVNDDGTIELTDAIHLLLYLFIDRSIVIPPPFIGPGFDSTP